MQCQDAACVAVPACAVQTLWPAAQLVLHKENINKCPRRPPTGLKDQGSVCKEKKTNAKLRSDEMIVKSISCYMSTWEGQSGLFQESWRIIQNSLKSSDFTEERPECRSLEVWKPGSAEREEAFISHHEACSLNFQWGNYSHPTWRSPTWTLSSQKTVCLSTSGRQWRPLATRYESPTFTLFLLSFWSLICSPATC